MWDERIGGRTLLADNLTIMKGLLVIKGLISTNEAPSDNIH